MTDRITPWQLVFGAPKLDESRFVEILEQAAGDMPDTVATLLQLPAAGELLREMMPAQMEPETRAEAVAQVGALLFHGFRYWHSGRTVLRVDERALRRLVAEPADAQSISPPAEAGYIQLPRNTLWATVAEGAAAEPADGIFWSATTSRLDLLLVLGLRRDRPGLSLVPVALEGEHDLAQWARADARPDGDDFANVLPGGELNQYLSILTHAEVVRLAALCFAAAASAEPPALEGDERVLHVHG